MRPESLEDDDCPDLVPGDELPSAMDNDDEPPPLFGYDIWAPPLLGYDIWDGEDSDDGPPPLISYDVDTGDVEWANGFSGVICYVDDTFNQLTGNREEGKHENKQPDRELFVKRNGDPEE